MTSWFRVACVALGAVLIAGCSEGGSNPSAFAGCYTPALHPDVDVAQSSASQTWMRLDTTVHASATGATAYTVSVGGLTPDAMSFPWRGWWSPLGADSLEVIWTSGTFGLMYGLRLRSDG